MLEHSNPRRFALLLALTSSLFAAQAAEVSPAERVETTPGLSPDAVRGVFNRRRQELTRCMRLVYVRKANDPSRGKWEHVVWKELPDTDDRVQLRFALSPEGRVLRDGSRDASFSVRGLYLDIYCAEKVIETWSFPPFPGSELSSGTEQETVQVEVWARFRTTAAERQAALTRMREEISALCDALSAVGASGRPPEREQWRAVLSRFLSERGTRMDKDLRQSIEAILHVNAADGTRIFENAVEELLGSQLECPVMHSWLEKL